jgi:hypothetical protein
MGRLGSCLSGQFYSSPRDFHLISTKVKDAHATAPPNS